MTARLLWCFATTVSGACRWWTGCGGRAWRTARAWWAASIGGASRWTGASRATEPPGCGACRPCDTGWADSVTLLRFGPGEAVGARPGLDAAGQGEFLQIDNGDRVL